jgi:hypothetical protein
VAIALVCEVVLAFLRADGCEGVGDRRKECVDRPGGNFSQQCFELCEELFDEVGTVGRQVAQLGAGDLRERVIATVVVTLRLVSPERPFRGFRPQTLSR